MSSSLNNLKEAYPILLVQFLPARTSTSLNYIMVITTKPEYKYPTTTNILEYLLSFFQGGLCNVIRMAVDLTGDVAKKYGVYGITSFKAKFLIAYDGEILSTSYEKFGDTETDGNFYDMMAQNEEFMQEIYHPTCFEKYFARTADDS